MNWQLRALLVLVPVLALGGVVLLSTGSKSKPVPPRGSGGAPSEVQTRSVPSDSAVSVVAAPPPPPSKPSVVPEKPTEDSLATAMHALEDTDPEQALELARHGQALWPNGTLAAEFAATEVGHRSRAANGRSSARRSLKPSQAMAGKPRPWWRRDSFERHSSLPAPDSRSKWPGTAPSRRS